MKLMLTVCLASVLLYTAESLRCYQCTNESCSNSTSVLCPLTSTVCRTITSVRLSNTIASVTVGKNCSSPLSCITPNNVETEWSVNRGFKKEAHTQICCTTDNCNLGTLAVMSNSTEMLELGCISSNLCGIPLILEAVLSENAVVTCGAPWTVSVSGLLLTFALTACKVLV
ncbi:lymphocyte antigen 6D-like isoform X2 [Sparus aurata]|uniref:lymphocyte antigen 6D-like isoform X2 n=1 Tax=Sparus aurata TaxID=8175 RepID=UPI0011C17C23|nr:lymphocyte antigen 6D-like isoform X2 [Sparus aurata]